MKEKKFLLVLALVFVVCNFWLLLSNGAWWDDWGALLHRKPEEIFVNFLGGGQHILAFFHYFMASNVDETSIPVAYHIIIFLIWGTIVWLTYKTLDYFNLDVFAKRAVCLLVSALPLCASRICYIDMTYNFSVLFFSIGAYTFIRYLQTRRWGYRIVTFILFMGSMLVWTACLGLIPAFLLFMAIYEQKEETSSKKEFVLNVVKRLVSWLDLVACVALFLVMRQLFLLPQGAYAEYYGISLGRVLRIPLQLVHTSVFVLWDIVKTVAKLPYHDISFIVFAVIVFAGAWLGVNKVMPAQMISERGKFNYKTLAVGAFLWLAALAPSSLVQCASITQDSSRYFAPAIVPFALCVVWVISLFRNARVQRYLLGFIVGLSVLMSTDYYKTFQISWFRDEALCAEIKANPLLQTPYTNVWMNGNYYAYFPYRFSFFNFYHLSGVSRYALGGDQTHLYLDSRDHEESDGAPLRFLMYDNFKEHSDYNCKDRVDPQRYQRTLTIDKGDKEFSLYQTVRLMGLYHLDREAFSKQLPDYLKFTVTECDFSVQVDSI